MPLVVARELQVLREKERDLGRTHRETLKASFEARTTDIVSNWGRNNQVDRLLDQESAWFCIFEWFEVVV